MGLLAPDSRGTLSSSSTPEEISLMKDWRPEAVLDLLAATVGATTVGVVGEA